MPFGLLRAYWTHRFGLSYAFHTLLFSISFCISSVIKLDSNAPSRLWSLGIMTHPRYRRVRPARIISFYKMRIWFCLEIIFQKLVLLFLRALASSTVIFFLCLFPTSFIQTKVDRRPTVFRSTNLLALLDRGSLGSLRSCIVRPNSECSSDPDVLGVYANSTKSRSHISEKPLHSPTGLALAFWVS